MCDHLSAQCTWAYKYVWPINIFEEEITSKNNFEREGKSVSLSLKDMYCLTVHLTGLVQFFPFPLYIEWVQSTVMVANFVGQNESVQKNCHDGLPLLGQSASIK